MPKLILKFDDRELQECAVGVQPVTIGRLPDNMVVIDNAAVSGRHARVYKEGNHYVLEDLKSTNGTFVNDKPIARHTLLEGDVVSVGKHSLVFTQKGGEQAPAAGGDGEQFVPEIGGTMVLDTLKHKTLLAGLDQGRPSQSHAVIPKTTVPTASRAGSVKVISGKSDQSHYVLASVTTVIGKADNAQIKTKGWFKPKVSAAIARKGEGYSVTPTGAKVFVNGTQLSGRHELSDGDMIEVSGLTLEFHLE
jgi:pSer/pThr/pTyr-binding forkhead associated (FHA) protein